MKYLFFTLLICSFSILGFSQKIDSTQNKTNVGIEDVKNEILREISNVKKELKEDDRELIKDFYSSNIEKIQLIIAIILGFFTVASVLGFVNINNLRKKYREQLDDLNQTKTTLLNDLEFKIKSIEIDNKSINELISKLSEEGQFNLSQLKKLELISNAKTYYQDRDYNKAIEECTLILRLIDDGKSSIKEINNVSILKAKSYLKLFNYSESISIYRDVLSVDSRNKRAILNLAEAYLLNGQKEAYGLLKKDYSSEIESSKNRNITHFLDLFESVSDVTIEKFLKNWEEHKDKMDFIWNFHDIKEYLYTKANDKMNTNYDVLLNIISFLEKKITSKELDDKLLTLTSLSN